MPNGHRPQTSAIAVIVARPIAEVGMLYSSAWHQARWHISGVGCSSGMHSHSMLSLKGFPPGNSAVVWPASNLCVVCP